MEKDKNKCTECSGSMKGGKCGGCDEPSNKCICSGKGGKGGK